jgi:hypothetical protein
MEGTFFRTFVNTVKPILSWLWALSMRFVSGIIDGIMYTPIFEALFWGIRVMHNRRVSAIVDTIKAREGKDISTIV